MLTNNQAHDDASVKTDVVAPATGELVELKYCSDSVFAQGMLGPGFVVKPESGKVLCPVAGTIKLIHATNHGYAITTPAGQDVLIHLGTDTVKLGDEPFSPQVRVGDKVEAGDTLAEVRWSIVRANGCSDEIIVVVSEADASAIELLRTGQVIAGETVAAII